VLGSASLNACAGGAPLLHPAHTLPENQVSVAAGTTGHFALGSLQHADRRLDTAAAMSGGVNEPRDIDGFVQGALTRFAVAPGVAPFVAARVGLGGHNEAGLSYTARAFRLDGRHAIEWPSVALSFGAVATGVLSRPGDEPSRRIEDEPGGSTGFRTFDLTSLNGYGLELPLLFGYRSDADVVKLWAGVRAGLERDSANVTLVFAPDTAVSSRADATRFWGGGLVGFSVGLAPIEVRVELDAAYQSIHGNLLTGQGERSANVAGWSLTPAMAISAKL
jgi:hypothetical protein